MDNKEKTVEIIVKDNGSLMLKGEVKLTDEKGNEIATTNPMWLCRCGHSKNKPFCDGSHREAGFKG
jgi:CDGSH iron-sulfur domain-containing protein 3